MNNKSWIVWLVGAAVVVGGLLWFFWSKKATPTKKSRTYVDENGYLRRSSDDKLVHRIQAALKLGRPLFPGEVVHHINRNKRDNRWSNLYVFRNQAAHDAVHRLDLARTGAW